MTADIPAEGRLPFTDIVVPIHWENHAALMFAIWFVIVPFAVVFLRYGKVAPSTYGIPRGTSKWAWPELCWTLHKRLLYLAIGLALGGAALAAVLTGGFSGSLHAWFGVATLLLGVGQGLSAWFRGSHGGRKDPAADPADRATWGGDHFDMTPRRRWFEAWHKTAGYFVLFCSGGAVATGLAQFWMPWLAAGFAGIVAGGLVLAVVLQGLGRHHDTYLSVYGAHPDHPFNRSRFDRLFADRGKTP
jgi:hypothetical protein